VEAGLERANLRALLGIRCLAAAAADVHYVRQEEDTEDLLGVQTTLVEGVEMVGALCDSLERMLAAEIAALEGS